MRRLFLLLLILLLPGTIGFGAFLWRFMPHPPAADYAEPATPLEARLQDLDYLRKLPITDKSFSEAGIVVLNQQIDALETQADSLSDAAFAMAVAKAAAIPENGHTGLSRTDLHRQLNSLPVRFQWFDDGLYILRAHRQHTSLLGARVVSYDGQAPETILDGVRAYVGGNGPWERSNSAKFFAAPAGLHAVGLISEPSEVTFELMLQDGTAHTITLDVEAQPTDMIRQDQMLRHEPVGVELESGNDWVALYAEELTNSRLTRRPADLYWTEALPGGGHYVRLGGFFDTDEVKFGPWLKGVGEDLKTTPRDYLVLDIRHSPGGDYTKAQAFAKDVANFVKPGGKIYILTNAETFSAAIVTVAFAKHAGGQQSEIVGEEIGDFEQFWAEGGAGSHTLPNSGFRIWVSTGYHDWENGCTDWSKCFWVNIVIGVAAGSLEPTMPAPLSFVDFVEGRDPAMDAVFAAEGL